MSLGGLQKLLNKIGKTGTAKHLPGSGHLRTAQTQDNINEVEALVLSLEDLPQTHGNQR